MKTLHFLLAATALASAPTFAAPAETPATPPASAAPALAVVPQLDAKAVALMDESVKAYAALGQLSQKFAVASSVDGKVDSNGSGDGLIAIQKPSGARVEAKIGGGTQLFVADGATFTYLINPRQYLQQPMQRNSISNVVESMPSAAEIPLSLLVAGRNPISDDSAPKWQRAQLSSKDGLPGVVLLGPVRANGKSATFGFYLDPQTHLLARVEFSVPRSGETGQPDSQISEITTLTASGEAVTPATFQYVPGPGIERFYPYDKSLVVGAQPFALTGLTLDGKPISLDDYKGKVVLLDFWATWCPPCRAEIPNVVANYKKHHAQGFDVVSISVDDEDSEDILRKFVAANEMTWPQLYDRSYFEGPNARAYSVKALPVALLIGKDGKIAAVSPRGEDLEPAILAALAR